MRYLSEYGKNMVFDTEQECLEYENTEKKKLEEARKMRETDAMERQEKLDEINKKYHEFEKLVSEFQEKYGTRQKIYFSPLCELIDCLS